MSDKVEITYYTDPLCCWSWGMQKHIDRINANYEDRLEWRYCMGGLLPEWKRFRDDVYAVSRPAQMGPVWMEAAHLTQTKIDSSIWIKDPPVSSYLACIAVKCAFLQSKKAGEIYLVKVREAVMEKGENISFKDALLDIAAKTNEQFASLLNLQQLSNDLQNGIGKNAFRQDLSEVQQFGISRFPTLILKSKFQPSLIVTGYRPYEMLESVVDAMLKPKEQTSA